MSIKKQVKIMIAIFAIITAFAQISKVQAAESTRSAITKKAALCNLKNKVKTKSQITASSPYLTKSVDNSEIFKKLSGKVFYSPYQSIPEASCNYCGCDLFTHHILCIPGSSFCGLHLGWQCTWV
jgi:hypothetical protein